MNQPMDQRRSKTSARREGLAAFTLVEVMISSALMALILTSAYLCLGAGFSAQKLVEPRAEIIQNARVALGLVSADLRSACSLSKTDDFIGMPRTVGDIEADNLDFGTHNYSPRHAREGDFCQESLYLDKDPATGDFSLWRRRNPTLALNALSGGAKEEIAQGVVGFKVEYYDGTDWYSSWGNTEDKKNQAQPPSTAREQGSDTGLPDAVRITLLMDSNPKKKAAPSSTGEVAPEAPLVFRTVVRLNLAEATQEAANNSGSNNGGNPGNAPNQPNSPPQ